MILSKVSPKLLEEWSYSQNIHPPESNLSSRTRIHWVCRNCRKGWTAELGARTRKSKSTGCPYCSRKRSLKAAHDSTRKIIDLSSYPEILKDFSQRDNPTINKNRIEGSSTIITWVCHNCKFKWSTSVGNRIKSSNQTGCPQCSKRIIKEKQRFNAIKNSGTIVDLFPELLKDWDYSKNLFNPKDLPYRSKEKIFWKCYKCSFVWKTALQNRTKPSNPTGCPSCSKGSSKLEEEFRKVLKKLYQGEIIKNSRTIKTANGSFEIDFLLPEISLGFEIQDFATHSKYSDNELCEFKGQSFLKRGPTYHELKRTLAMEQLNVVLIDVWEDLIRSDKLEAFLRNILEEFVKIESLDIINFVKK